MLLNGQISIDGYGRLPAPMGHWQGFSSDVKLELDLRMIRTAWLIWGLLSLSFFSACTPSTDEPLTSTEVAPTAQPATATIEPVTPSPTAAYTPTLYGEVRIWASWSPNSMQTLVRLIDEFEEINPGVTFSLTYLEESELLSKLEEANSAGQSPSVIFGSSRWGPSLLESDTIQELTDLLPPDFLAEIDPLAIQQVESNGTILGVPIHLNGSVLFRNPELAPNPATTITELVEASKLIEEQVPNGAILDFGFERSFSLSSACGGEILHEDGSHEMASELGMCWLELLQTLAEAGEVLMNSDEDTLIFQSGMTAWIIDDSSSRSLLLNSLGAEALVVDRWPVYSATGTRLAGFVWTENAYLLSQVSELDRDASLAFLVFLLSPESQLTLAQTGHGGMVPVLAALESSEPIITQLQAALRDGIPYPLGLEQHPLLEPFERAARAVAIQGAELETAQLRALEEIQDLETSPDQ